MTSSLAAAKEISMDTATVAVLLLKVERWTIRFTLLLTLFGKSLVNPLTGRKFWAPYQEINPNDADVG